MDESHMMYGIDQLIEHGLHGQTGALDEATDRTQELRDSDMRDWYFGKIVRALLQFGNWAKAIDLAKQIQDSIEKKDALLAIANNLITNTQNQKAELVLTEAEKVINAISGESYWLWQKAEALNQIALLMLRINKKDYAITLWQQAVDVAKLGQEDINNIQEKVDCASVLAEIAQNLARIGDFILAKSVGNEIRIEKRRSGTLSLIAEIEGDNLSTTLDG